MPASGSSSRSSLWSKSSTRISSFELMDTVRHVDGLRYAPRPQIGHDSRDSRAARNLLCAGSGPNTPEKHCELGPAPRAIERADQVPVQSAHERGATPAGRPQATNTWPTELDGVAVGDSSRQDPRGGNAG